jgi:hypothetical protein
VLRRPIRATKEDRMTEIGTRARSAAVLTPAPLGTKIATVSSVGLAGPPLAPLNDRAAPTR